MRKPISGEKLFLVRHKRWSDTEYYNPEVIKVGRKYFTVEFAWRKMQFYIDTWRENTEYGSNYMIYESKQHYLDETERNKLFEVIKEKFQYKWNNKFTLQQLRDVSKTLNIKIKT